MGFVDLEEGGGMNSTLFPGLWSLSYSWLSSPGSTWKHGAVRLQLPSPFRSPGEATLLPKLSEQTLSWGSGLKLFAGAEGE